MEYNRGYVDDERYGGRNGDFYRAGDGRGGGYPIEVRRQDSEPPADYDDVRDVESAVGGANLNRTSSSPSNNNNNVYRQRRGRSGDSGSRPTSDASAGSPDGIEMTDLGGSGRYDNSSSGDWAGGHGLRHRRAKSQHVRNGFEYYRNNSNRRHDDEDDRRSLQSINLEDLKETRKFLATVRIRRKSRKRYGSSKKAGSGEVNDDVDTTVDDSVNNDDEYEEEVGLPSARQKIKALTDRLIAARQMHSLREVAVQYREAVESTDDPGLNLYPKHLAKSVRIASSTFRDVVDRVNFWSRQFKEIEGQFGIATTTYFRFTRWLVKINLILFILFCAFIYIPQLTYDSVYDKTISNLTGLDKSFVTTYQCSQSYSDHLDNITESRAGWSVLIDILQGTGDLEKTMLFYGFYTNKTIYLPSFTGDFFEVKYDMGLAYILTIGISIFVIFIMIVKNSSRTIRETVMDFDNKAFPLYSNAVFGGWDFCINSGKMANFKKKIIYNEFRATLEEVQAKRNRENRSGREWTRLYVKRFIINIIVLALLGGSFAAVYFSTNFLLEKQTEQLSEVVLLLVNYLPSIVISVLNVIVPEIFMLLSELEEYTQLFGIYITIARAVILRLSSVWVLIVSLYVRLHSERERDPYSCPEENKSNITRCCGNALWVTDIENDTSNRGTVKCWESYVGQQFYKLTIVDFFAVTLVVFLLNLPRRFLVDKFRHKYWIVNSIGRSKFDLPIQVLDIVYTQSLCWSGMIFTPVLPAITLFKVFVFFFLKKFEVYFVTEAPQNAYRGSRSYSFFQTILLVSFTAIVILMGYMVGNLEPSMSCGPFRLHSKEDFVMFDVITNEVNSWPHVVRNIVQFFGTVAFFIPAIVILLLAIYYFTARTSGYKTIEELLKLHIKSEAHDKQFLLARVDEIIKKGQLITDEYR